jgi:DNA-binding PadR family transcriptional regulator
MLRYAILSLLSDFQMTGYQLAQSFGSTVAHFWSAKTSQIYPELHRLEEEGLVRSTSVAQRGKPDKRPYSLTAKGKKTLREWIQTSPGPVGVRDEMQIRAFNFGRMPLAAALELLAERKQQHEQRIAHYQELAEGLRLAGLGPGTPINDRSGWRIALEAGIRAETAYAEWCDWAAQTLKQSWAKAK